MRKKVNLLTIIILLQAIFYTDPWQQRQKFFEHLTGKNQNAETNQKADSNFNIDNIINAINANNGSIGAINGYNGNISGAVNSWTNNSDAQNTYNNITAIINKTQKR